MNRGLLLKACCEVRGITILCAVFLFGFQMILAFVFPAIFEDFGGQFMRTRFGKMIFSSSSIFCVP